MKYLGSTSSGSQADQVFSHNRYGQYVRRRATPVNKKTSFQTTARTTLAQQSTRWSQLAAGTRAAWEAWSSGHPLTDALGQSLVLSGHAYFVRTNCQLVGIGESQVDSPPPAEPTWWSTTITITAAQGAGTVEVAFTPVPPALYAVQIEMGPPRDAGRAFESNWKSVAKIGVSSSSPLSIGTNYGLRWGAWQSGQTIFYRVRKVWLKGAWTPWNTNQLLVAV